MPDAPDSPPPPVHRDWSKSLLGWYYSTTGTVIRLAFYILVILGLVAWQQRWFVPEKPATAQRLEKLDVIGWKEKRWAKELPLSTPLNQFPFIELTLAAPPGYGKSITLEGLADNLNLFHPGEPPSLLSLPIEMVDAPDAKPDDAVKPRSFNNQVILSFLINPDCLPVIPAEIWLGYMDTGTVEKPTLPTLIRLATLNAQNFQGAEMRQIEPPSPAAPVTPAPEPSPQPVAPTAVPDAPPPAAPVQGPTRPEAPPAPPIP